MVLVQISECKVEKGQEPTIHPGFPALYLVKALVRLSQLRDLS